MHPALVYLKADFEDDVEGVVERILLINAIDTGTATDDERFMYRSSDRRVNGRCRQVINEFSNAEGLFNIDHIAWQLGIDITADGPVVVDPPFHVCVEESMSYLGHWGRRSTNTGSLHQCIRCHKIWHKRGDTFYE